MTRILNTEQKEKQEFALQFGAVKILMPVWSYVEVARKPLKLIGLII